MPTFHSRYKPHKYRSIQPKACISWRANRDPLNFSGRLVTIAAGIMLGRPIIPHHNRSRPPFHPHLISWVINAILEMTEHCIRIIGCQLANGFGRYRFHKQGFNARHRMFSQNRAVSDIFSIDDVGKLGRDVPELYF